MNTSPPPQYPESEPFKKWIMDAVGTMVFLLGSMTESLKEIAEKSGKAKLKYKGKEIIMLEDLAVWNPDFCIFDFFINRIHYFFQMFVIRKCTFFHIIISGCLKHPFRNLFFLLYL